LEWIWKEAAMAKIISRHVPGDTEVSYEKLRQDCRNPRRDWNRALSEHKSRVLLQNNLAGVDGIEHGLF
jgi:hypothetical protein